jgi:anti-anti-sigma factor
MTARWIPQVSRFAVHRRDDEVVLGLCGEIDISNVDEFERQLDTAAFSLPAKLIVDCRELEFIDGRGGRLLLATAQVLEGFGSSVVLRSPKATVRRVLDLLGGGTLTIEP